MRLVNGIAQCGSVHVEANVTLILHHGIFIAAKPCHVVMSVQIVDGHAFVIIINGEGNRLFGQISHCLQ